MKTGGIENSPRSNINGIRTLLNGYGTEPAFLKELIQNADDAHASWMGIFLIDHVEGAEHPLLNGPLLVVANNSPFESHHEDGLRGMGLGTKGGDSGSIGKFGLGIKSVFLVVEAIFYAALNRSGDPQELKPIGFLNPWSGLESPFGHPEWDLSAKESGPNDLRRIVDLLGERLDPKKPAFLLVLPLRTQQMVGNQAALHTGFPGDEPQRLWRELIFTFHRIVPLALPMLGYLTNLELWTRDTNSDWKLLEQAALDHDAPRPFRLPGDNGKRHNGGLRTLLKTTQAETQVLALCEWSNNSQLSTLTTSTHWPRTSRLNIRGNSREWQDNVPDRSVPQGGVGILWREPADPELGRIRIMWSVFLPVGDHYVDLSLSIPLSLDLLLQGCFYLDDKRTGLDGLEHHFQQSEPDSLQGVRREWNRLLATKTTLPLIPKALELLACELPESHVSTVVRALRTSRLWGEFSLHVTELNAFGLCLDRHGNWHWSAVLRNERLRIFRWHGETQEVTKSLPGFVQAASHLTVILEDNDTHPVLLGGAGQENWTANEVNEVLHGLARDHFELRPGSLSVLKAFLDGLQGDAMDEAWRELDEVNCLEVENVNRHLSLQSPSIARNLVVQKRLFGSDLSNLLQPTSKACPTWNPLILRSTLPGAQQRVGALSYDSSIVPEIVLSSETLGTFSSCVLLANTIFGESNDACRYLLHRSYENRLSRETLYVTHVPDPDGDGAILKHVLTEHGQEWRYLPPEADFTHQRRTELGLLFANANGLIDLLWEIGPRTNFSGLTTAQRLHVIKICPEGLLRDLRVHDLKGEPLRQTKADGTAYLQDDSLHLVDARAITLWDELAAQTRMVQPLDDGILRDKQERVFEDYILDVSGALIRISRQDNVAHYWPLIMTLLAMGTPRSEACEVLREARWLPLIAGEPTNPANVVQIDGADDAIHGLISAAADGASSFLSAIPELRNHPGSNTLKSHIIAQGAHQQHLPNSLILLSTALQAQDHRTGFNNTVTVSEWQDLASALAGFTEQQWPLLPLLQILFINYAPQAEAVHENLTLPLAGVLGAGVYVRALNWLALRIGDGAGAFESGHFRAFSLVLETAVNYGLWTQIRGEIRLPNRLKHWKATDEIVLEGQGISESFILKEDLRHLLSNAIERTQEPNEKPPKAGSAAKVLSTYFKQFPPRAKARIGVLLTWLGGEPAVENLAREFSGGIEDLGERRKRMMPENVVIAGGHPVEVIQFTRFRPQIVEHQQSLEFLSLAGTRLEIPLQTSPRTLLAGTEAELWHRHEDAGGGFHILTLLPSVLFIDLDERAVCDAVTRATLTVLRCVYLNDVDDSAIFSTIEARLVEEMEKAESMREDMPLLLAQEMILSTGGSLIPMLGLRRHDLFRAVVEKWERAKRLRAQAQAENRGEEPGEARTLENEARQAMRTLLSNDGDAQRLVLEAVRKKLAAAHYKAESIPFELLQNADDAYLELELLDGQIAGVPFFQVDCLPESVRFSHTGRRINHPLSEGTRGFNRDLEKMVQLHVSDKDLIQEGSQESAVTGKFGLGFKSCLLATDTPAFVSGDLKVRIKGGVYPVLLEDTIAEDLHMNLQRMGGNLKRDGTMFELPCRGGDLAVKFARFVMLAPYAVACTRRVRRIVVDSHAVDWLPETLGPISKGTVGEIRSGADRTRLVSLCGGTETNPWQVVFRLDSNGFCQHFDHVPAIWVTMPVDAVGGFGVFINASFDLNAGRTQLVKGSEKNQALAKDIGLGLTGFLREWLDWTRSDWLSARQKMRIGADVSVETFWSSAWSALTTGLHTSSGEDEIAELLRQILFRSHDGTLVGYARLLNSERIIPAQKGPHILLKLQEIAGVTHGIIDQNKDFFDTLTAWPDAPSAMRQGALISAEVASILNQIINLPLLERFDFARAMFDVINGGVSPAKADTLGRVLTKTSWSQMWKSFNDRKEEEAVLELLHKCRFKSESGTYEEVDRLVAIAENPDTPDEPLRAALAPPGRVLSGDYGDQARAFFLLCRERLHADAEDLEEWIRSATVARRTDVLRFLLGGDDRVRGNVVQRLGGGWFDSVSEWPEFRALPPSDQSNLRHLAGLYVTTPIGPIGEDNGEEPEVPLTEEPGPPPIDGITPEILLRWWRNARLSMDGYAFSNDMGRRLFRLESQQRLSECLREGSQTSAGRQAWFRALVYCSLMGERVHREQVRRFSGKLLEPGNFFDLVTPPNGRGNSEFFVDRTADLFDGIVHSVLRGANASREEAALWRRIFYDARKMFVLVYEDDFPDRLLDVARNPSDADTWVNYVRNGSLPGQAADVSVAGQSFASPILFLLRELCRLGVVANESLYELSIYPSGQVLRAARRLRFLDDDGIGRLDYFDYLKEAARRIHNHIRESNVYRDFFGADRRFDIPLLALEDNNRYDELQHIAQQ